MNKGNLAVKVAKEWFEDSGWLMYKVEPELRITGKSPRGFTCVFVGNKGLPDFLGEDNKGKFCAVEIKAAPKGWIRFPCSYLKPEQRKFISEMPAKCLVGVYWSDGVIEFFKFKERGSYRKGTGLT